jgi:hypothetical protein
VNGLSRFKWLYLFGGLVLVLIGAGIYAAARPAAPSEIDGTIASYLEYTQGGAYDHNELQLAGDRTSYTVDKTNFHPPLPNEVYKDGAVSIWVDGGSNNVIAITLSDENDQNPVKYTTDQYDNPASERSDGQVAGIVTGIIGALLIGLFALMSALGRDRRPAAVLLSDSTSAGMSPDGKWYWDGWFWNQVSEDGNWRWDGTQWLELGTVYAARGAPPPPEA